MTFVLPTWIISSSVYKCLIKVITIVCLDEIRMCK